MNDAPKDMDGNEHLINDVVGKKDEDDL